MLTEVGVVEIKLVVVINIEFIKCFIGRFYFYSNSLALPKYEP